MGKYYIAPFCIGLLSIGHVYAADNTASVFPLPSPSSPGTKLNELGKYLYEDKVFSDKYIFSCNSCHSLEKSGVDHLPVYIGVNKIPGNYNTPTTLNAKLNFRQFWNGRVKSLSEVIDNHIADNTIFNNTWENILKRLNNNETYTDLFKQNYLQGEVSSENVKNALLVFLSNLVTPKSPFDQYLNGHQDAISDNAKQGFELFQKYGCVTCHEGANLGGNLFQKLGIYKDYYYQKKYKPADLGLYTFTKKEEDKFFFKVPSLRNVALTAPYLHDGSISTLQEMIQIMGIYQVGQTIPDDDIALIINFLESLNGVQEH